LEDNNAGLKRDKGKLQRDLDELQDRLDEELRKKSALRAENDELNGGIADGKGQHSKLKNLVE